MFGCICHKDIDDGRLGSKPIARAIFTSKLQVHSCCVTEVAANMSYTGVDVLCVPLKNRQNVSVVVQLAFLVVHEMTETRVPYFECVGVDVAQLEHVKGDHPFLLLG